MFINSDTNLASAPLMETLSELVSAGKLRMPHLDGPFGLAQVASGFKRSESGHVVGKVSVVVER